MNKITFLLAFSLSLVFNQGISQETDLEGTFRELFFQANDHLEEDEYNMALPILMKMYEMDKENANTAFSIGNCYLHTPHERMKAIPYYEQALGKLTPGYDPGSPAEKKAPLETYKYLGQAYHFNYEFDKAVEQYEEYKSILSKNNRQDMELINRDLEITRNARQLVNNPVQLTVEALPVLNSEYDEYRPKLNAEENLLFFTSRRKGISEEKDHVDKYFEDIYFSVKEKDYWTEPVRLDSKINTPSHDACLYISPDAKLMYVYRFEEGGDAGGSIYKSTMKDGVWSEPKKMDEKINSEYYETSASLNSFGNVIFFTSERPKPKGIGGKDIWMMKMLPNGEWGDVQNLGETVNTEYDEESPYFHPDGKTLYFSSKGHKTMGGYDVFSTELQEDGSWSEPINLGYPINTTGDEVFYFPSLDGKQSYFSSYREGGKGEQDLYVMSLAGPKKSSLAIYKGKSSDCDGNIVKDLIVYIIDQDTGEEVGIFRPNENTGEFLFILQAGRNYDIEYEVNNISVTELVVLKDRGLQTINKDIILCGDTIALTNIDTTYHPVVDQDFTATISDRKSGQRVIGANVEIYTVVEGVRTLEKSLVSDVNGNWINEFKEDMSYDIEISAEGYEERSFKVLSLQKDPHNRANKLLSVFIAQLDPIEMLASNGTDTTTTSTGDPLITQNGTGKDTTTTSTTGDPLITQNTVDSTLNVGGALVFNRVHFVYDKSRLVEESKGDLKKVVAYMKKYKGAKMLISGHTDNKGEEEYNMKLSKARANRVRHYLSLNGISKTRIVTEGHGETMPIADNENKDGSDNPKGRAKNRRVEFSLIK